MYHALFEKYVACGYVRASNETWFHCIWISFNLWISVQTCCAESNVRLLLGKFSFVSWLPPHPWQRHLKQCAFSAGQVFIHFMTSTTALTAILKAMYFFSWVSFIHFHDFHHSFDSDISPSAFLDTAPRIPVSAPQTSAHLHSDSPASSICKDSGASFCLFLFF